MRLTAAIALLAVGLMAGTPAFAETNVGVTAAVNQDAKSVVGSNIKTISLGDSVVFNQRIETGGGGLVQVLLADGTTFMVGPNSNLVIDSFVYDPNAGTAQVTASFTKGVLRFIGGQTSKTEGGVTINTPVGTMGIRGAMVDIVLDPPAGTPPHIDMLFGNEVTLEQGQQLLGRLYAAGYSLALGADGKFDVLKTPPGWGSQIQAALAGKAGTKGGAPKGPSDGDVKNSDVADNNSGNGANRNAGNPGLSKEELDALLYAAAHYDEIRNYVNNNQAPQGFVGGIVNVTNIQWPEGYWEDYCGEGSECLASEYHSASNPWLNTHDPETDDAAYSTVAFDENGAPLSIVVPLAVDDPDCASDEGGCLDVRYEGTNGQGEIIITANGATQTFPMNSAYLEDYSTRLEDSELLGQLDCDCADLVRWGFWGFSASSVGYTNGQGSSADVSLDGLWITGDLTTRAQLANLANQSEENINAYYSGDAVGFVTNADVDGSYVATGDLTLGWNFGSRDGSATVSGFDQEHFEDGRTFEYNIYSVDDMTNFTGDLVTGDDPPSYMEGNMQGAFVNDGSDYAAGVMGNWGVIEYDGDNNTHIPDYAVGGVFMGQQVTPN